LGPSASSEAADNLTHIADAIGRLFSSFLVLPSITFDTADDAAVRNYARAVIAPLMLN
jgi:hypothetical protein